MNDALIGFRLLGMVLVCWVVPAVLCHFAGPALGAVGALAAAAFWYHQYRFPARKDRSGAYWGYVTGGYAIISITLVICLGRCVK